jgi:hypothetical protein
MIGIYSLPISVREYSTFGGYFTVNFAMHKTVLRQTAKLLRQVWEVRMKYEYDTALHELPEKGGAYVVFPWNLKEETGKGRLKVHATFDAIPYDGSIVNMGLKNSDGSICYIIGVLKSIRASLDKHDGDSIHVVITER